MTAVFLGTNTPGATSEQKNSLRLFKYASLLLCCDFQKETCMLQENPSPLYQRIYALIRQVTPGYVTYGRIGQRVGCTARTVGFALV